MFLGIVQFLLRRTPWLGKKVLILGGVTLGYTIVMDLLVLVFFVWKFPHDEFGVYDIDFSWRRGFTFKRIASGPYWERDQVRFHWSIDKAFSWRPRRIICS